MAYMNQERKATIAAKIKPILKKYNLKGSLSVRNHSTVVLTIKSGDIDFIGNFNKVAGSQSKYNSRGFNAATTNIDVNPYWYHEHFDGVAKQALDEILPAMKSAGWYNNSDAMIDYFDTAYYIDVNVGKWDKAYELTK